MNLNIDKMRLHLKQLKAFRGFSILRLSKLIGVSNTTLNTFLLGGGIRLDTLEKMNRFLEDHYDRLSKMEHDSE